MQDDQIRALSGSRAADRVVASVWYDGELVVPDLPIESWNMSWERSRQVQGQGSLVVVDAEGHLAPWAVDDPLGVGGSRARLSYILGTGGEVELGEYRITQSSASEVLRLHRTVTEMNAETGLPTHEVEGTWSSSGEVPVDLDDLTWCVLKAEFLSPETVGVPGSVIGEVERLCDDIVLVDAAPEVEDGPVPSSITYEGNRLDAIGALLRSIEAEYRMTSDAVLEIIPSDAGPVVWDITPGDEGVLVDFGRTYAADDLINTVVVEGKTEDDDPLIGVSRELTGPLSAEGPHGLMPSFRRSDILQTQARVDRAATTYRRNIAASRSIVVPITCLPHPGLQVADVVRLVTPAGELVGPVASVRLSGSARDGLHPMQVGLVAPLDQVQVIGWELRERRR